MAKVDTDKLEAFDRIVLDLGNEAQEVADDPHHVRKTLPGVLRLKKLCEQYIEGVSTLNEDEIDAFENAQYGRYLNK